MAGERAGGPHGAHDRRLWRRDPSSAPQQPSYPDPSYQPQDSGSAGYGEAEDPAAAAAASTQVYDALNEASQEQFDAQLNTARSLTP